MPKLMSAGLSAETLAWLADNNVQPIITRPEAEALYTDTTGERADYKQMCHGTLARMRNNIDAWWLHIEAGAEAIVSTASGCGAQLSDYGALLAHDPAYAARAQRVSELSRDIVQVLQQENLAPLGLAAAPPPLAVHVPCTLQHALGEPNAVQELLRSAGFNLVDCADGHLCCGSAGTHSILQAQAAERLRHRKLASLTRGDPACIVTANVGCQTHLGAASEVPVRHWIELVDEYSTGNS